MNFTPKDLEILESTITKQVEAEYNQTLDMFESGERDFWAYSKAGLSKYLNKYHVNELGIIGYYDPLSLSNDLNDFVEEYNNCTDIKTSIECYDYSREDSAAFGYAYNCYHVTAHLIESIIKNRVKFSIKEKLKPQSASFSKDVDCKLLQLFKDGTISWEALQKLVYSDCSI